MEHLKSKEITDTTIDLMQYFINTFDADDRTEGSLVLPPFTLEYDIREFILRLNDYVILRWDSRKEFSRDQIEFLKYFNGETIYTLDTDWTYQREDRHHKWTSPNKSVTVELFSRASDYEVHAPGQSWSYKNEDLAHMKLRWLLKEVDPWKLEYWKRQQHYAIQRYMKLPQVNKVTARILVEEYDLLTFDDLREANLNGMRDVPISDSPELQQDIDKLEDELGTLDEEDELISLRKKELVEKA
mgnify:CR=1 FL=1